MSAPDTTNPPTPRINSASPTSILQFIRCSPSPRHNPHTACPTCHLTPAGPHPQLAPYSLYSHGLSSVSPPAVLLHHVLPSPPPLLQNTSMGSQHLQSAASSTYQQLIDARFMYTAVPTTAAAMPHAMYAAHASYDRPTPSSASPSPAAHSAVPVYHAQPTTYAPYTYSFHPQPPSYQPHAPAAYTTPPTSTSYPTPPSSSHSTPTHPSRSHIDPRTDSTYRHSRSSHHYRLTEEEEQLAHFKTEICRTHLTTGHCQFNTDCQFAHSFDELRPRGYDSKYKTELCKRYHTLGINHCKFGSRCKFLHDEIRIKASDGEYWLCSELEGIIRVEVVPSHHYHRRQLLDQLTYYPPTGPVSPLSSSPVLPSSSRRRGRRSSALEVPEYGSAGEVEYGAGGGGGGGAPSLASLPVYLANVVAGVSPAHSTRSLPTGSSGGGVGGGGGMDSASTSTGSSGSGSGVSGVSYSMPSRYRRVGSGEFMLNSSGSRAV